jgi:D-alanyl-D-alanine carboxypeptidase/D-alanyl-D-alanine-endopeptidase (penicillin-binding protein 4)
LAVVLFAALATAGGAASSTPSIGERSLAQLARSILGAGQGVYVETADGAVLLSQAGGKPVHPASVSKVPTTLALLRKLGPDHRFTTTFLATGRLYGDTLDGDLLVTSDGDPYFVDENALLVAARLNQLGLRHVTGSLRPQAPLTFDWQPDERAVRLQQAMSGHAPSSAWEAVRAQLNGADLQGATPALPALRFDGAMATAGPVQPAQSLLVHRSQTLLELAKQLNDYSNNVFKPLADAAGGASAVEALARDAVPAVMRDEITLGDGAGTDGRNRLSPRAAVKLLRALEQELARSGHALVDILPVAGVDSGTLHDRFNSPDQVGRVVGKTGTFGDYGASALIGAIPTRDRGTVYFAILNHGVPVPIARDRQNRFIAALLARLQTEPWRYQPDVRPAIARALLDTTSASAPAPAAAAAAPAVH